MRTRNGKRKAALPLRQTEARAEHAVLLILDRGGSLGLRHISRGEAVQELMKLDTGFDLLVSESRAAAEDLTKEGAWRLSLSDDPVEAIDFIARHFGDCR